MSNRFAAYRSALINAAEKFSLSWEHYQEMWQTLEPGLVVIDLLSLRIEPRSFQIERNLRLASQCAQVITEQSIRSGLGIRWARLFLLPWPGGPSPFYLLLDSGIVEEGRCFTVIHPRAKTSCRQR